VSGARRRNAAPGQVRIVGGRWRGSKLPVPDRPGLRPTPDRVRETLFNWLGQDLGGWRVLDAFAGSGALGFEAASRGAAEVLLLERDPMLCCSLEASRARLGGDAMRIECSDAMAWMARAAARRRLERCGMEDSVQAKGAAEASDAASTATAGRAAGANGATTAVSEASVADRGFDLVLLDPPFGSDLLAPALVAALPLATPGGWFYIEGGESLAGLPPGLQTYRRLTAGAVHAQLLRRTG